METKFSAGIILSVKIAKRKKYFNHLILEEFKDYHTAEKRFFELYGDVVSYEEFEVNKLFAVRDKHIYSVFYSKNFVGITYTNNVWSNIATIVGEYPGRIWTHNSLEYDDAVLLARNKFVEQYGNVQFYIYGRIPINKIIMFEDMLRRNRLII